MNKTRAKFSCVEVSRTNDDTWKILLTPVYSGSAENRDFFRYTPGGSIALQVVETQTAGQFREGYDYYVDFTQVAEVR